MKNLIIFSTLIVMAVINFTGCGKAQERTAKPNKKIQSQVVAIDGLVDLTKAEHQNSEANMSFKRMLIAKLESAEKRDHADSLLLQNKLVYMLMDNKVVLLEFLPASMNKHASASANLEIASATTEVADSASKPAEVVEAVKLHTYESLIAMKNGQMQEMESLKTSTLSQNHFVILAEIEIQVGILENETTDYNEKKSTMKLTETSLEQAKVLLLKSEIKLAATADVSGDESK
ncbi:MAG: hypothetical protein V4654_00145 [Bdellovibrionota bacterium]